MRLYINITTKNYKAKKEISNNFPLDIDNLINLKNQVVTYFIDNYTWSRLLSFKVVGRLDSDSKTIDIKYFNRQCVSVIAKKQRFKFENGKALIVWEKEAVILE